VIYKILRNVKALFAIICCFFLFACSNVNNEKKQATTSGDEPLTEQVGIQQSGAFEGEIDLSEKKRCDSGIVLNTEENLDNLSDDLIYLFLYTFSEECKNNAEYGEFSNEVLFQVVNKYPEEFANNLKKEDIYKELILKELTSPINDIIDVKSLYDHIKGTSIEDQLKSQILEALQIGLNKY